MYQYIGLNINILYYCNGIWHKEQARYAFSSCKYNTILTSAGLSSYLDFTNPEVRQWYADQFDFKTYKVCVL